LRVDGAAHAHPGYRRAVWQRIDRNGQIAG
jgi:hypothetical protein